MRRLRWQCRRGVKELDALLCAYLDNQYAASGVTDQRLFSELLALEDDLLIAYFLADSLPEHQELKQLVKKIRSSFMG
ncbi:succinate dehydrogenase assembly factor 2 [Bathymodiolus japonicus methanotrophic gill symbiont]|uniref:succinate dehydrogenase assembly factor 2 n=1 Tax=Bathymodiolus japonicus methanotrophic gill symbiont TaxID=113269 RepID=UPI0021E129FB|nr:succinate dehydrogenase assembly factor 2 [Bathymodiolus japonicus methanotrophic gill symbiont]